MTYATSNNDSSSNQLKRIVNEADINSTVCGHEYAVMDGPKFYCPDCGLMLFPRNRLKVDSVKQSPGARKVGWRHDK
jgi:predicted RNA-binding Zn-ribbon protein involved in translation (DUF1610 family)